MSTQFEPAGHVIGSGVPEHLGEQKPSRQGRPSAQSAEVWHRAPPGSLESGRRRHRVRAYLARADGDRDDGQRDAAHHLPPGKTQPATPLGA